MSARDAWIEALTKFKHEWEAGREPVTIPRAQYEALMAAQPTEAMLNAARDWSLAKYGTPIGNDAAIGCWKAMHTAALHAAGIRGRQAEVSAMTITDEMVERAAKAILKRHDWMTWEEACILARAALEAALGAVKDEPPLTGRTKSVLSGKDHLND